MQEPAEAGENKSQAATGNVKMVQRDEESERASCGGNKKGREREQKICRSAEEMFCKKEEHEKKGENVSVMQH